MVDCWLVDLVDCRLVVKPEVKGVRKKFDKELYDACDGPGKEAVRIHLTCLGYDVTVPPENYGPDVYCEFNGRRTYHEIEVCPRWFKATTFPFPSGSIPERKHKLLARVGDSELFFWMLREDFSRAVVFPSTYIIDQYLVEVSNSKIKSGEYFYRIPLTLGKELDLICP